MKESKLYSYFKFDYLSGRTPGKSKKAAVAEEEEDLTRDMEDPTPEPNVTEVHIPKSSK